MLSQCVLLIIFGLAIAKSRQVESNKSIPTYYVPWLLPTYEDIPVLMPPEDKLMDDGGDLDQIQKHVPSRIHD